MEVVRCPEHGKGPGSQRPLGPVNLAWRNRSLSSPFRDFLLS